MSIWSVPQAFGKERLVSERCSSEVDSPKIDHNQLLAKIPHRKRVCCVQFADNHPWKFG